MGPLFEPGLSTPTPFPAEYPPPGDRPHFSNKWKNLKWSLTTGQNKIVHGKDLKQSGRCPKIVLQASNAPMWYYSVTCYIPVIFHF